MMATLPGQTTVLWALMASKTVVCPQVPCPQFPAQFHCLGFATVDSAAEGKIETTRCLAGHPQLVIRAASAVIGGVRINLLKSGILRIGEIERRPLTVGAPTDHLSVPTRRTGQSAKFRR